MKRLIRISTLVFALVLGAQAMAAEHVFGIDWQSTPAQLRAQDIALKLRRTDGRLSMYETKSLPKNLSDAETYLLIFDKDAGLVKIMMVGRNFRHDPMGVQGKKRFDELDKLLRSRGYTALRQGQTKTTDRGKRASGGFYECLRQPGCGAWKKAFRKDHVVVLMQLQGMAHGTGFIVMNFEEQPQFGQAVAKNAKTTTDKDADAF